MGNLEVNTQIDHAGSDVVDLFLIFHLLIANISEMFAFIMAVRCQRTYSASRNLRTDLSLA